MDKAHAQVLQKNRIAIKRTLTPNDTVIDFLYQEGIISSDSKDELVRNKNNPKEQANILLSLLPRAGTKAWDVFIQALKDSETEAHKELAQSLLESLEEYKREAGSLNWPVADPGRTPWDTTDPDWPGHSSSSSLRTSERVTRIDLDDASEVYLMVHAPRGIAYIINNKNFAPKSRLPKRNGTDVDANALYKLWTDFGFKTKMFTDVSGYDMRQNLRSLAKHDHSDYDCVIVSILTHGVKGDLLYASDGELVPVKELIQLFNAGEVHKSLIGKPRLFFLQACTCRGDDVDIGVDQPDGGALALKMLEDYDCTDGKLQSLPSQADMFIAYSTIPGYIAWRNSKCGTWFVQGIVDVFNRFADSEHLVDLMVRVNRYVAMEFEASGHNKQTPSPIIQLTKKLFFRPGYYKK